LAEGLDVIAKRMIPPRPGAASSASRGTAFIDSDGGVGVCSTRILLGPDALAMRLHLHRFLRLRGGRRFGRLLREGAGMYHETPEVHLTTLAIGILYIDTTKDTLASPASRGRVLGTAGFFE
jgi:hypothetical protein